MNPTKEKYYRGLFLISALYDSVLGCVFTFFPAQAFTALGIREKLPEFGGYISLLGVFVFVIGFAYYRIYRGDLRQNLDLILVGALYKLSYCAVVFYYWLFGTVPHPIFVALFGVADLLFFILMTECYAFLRKGARS